MLVLATTCRCTSKGAIPYFETSAKEDYNVEVGGCNLNPKP
jgi:hypothetical protein